MEKQLLDVLEKLRDSISKKIREYSTESNPLFEISETALVCEFVQSFCGIVKKNSFVVEMPIPNECFDTRQKNEKAKRPLRPKIDFYSPKNYMAVEFSMFKGNSNKKPEKPTNSTEKFCKLINDALRLFLFSKVTKSKFNYLVIVANESFINAKTRIITVDKFPFKELKVNHANLNEKKKDSNFFKIKTEDRYLKKLQENDSFSLNRIYNEELHNKLNIRLIAYRIQ